MSAVAIVMLEQLPVLLDVEDLPLIEGQKLTLHSEGYIRVGRSYLHRLITRARAGEIVDHVNGLRADCRRVNLRKGTKAQNGFNRGKARHNTTGFKGVYFCKQTGRFRAAITVDSRVVRLGRFQNAVQAAKAYDTAAKLLHGPFARLNFTAADDPGAVGKGCDA